CDGIRHRGVGPGEGGAEAGSGALDGGPGKAAAPAWFTRLVEPPQMEFRFPVESGDGAENITEIVFRTDPTDEIDEAWSDARVLLGLVLAFAVIANAVFFFAVGHWLRPLERIVSALDGIGRGDYSARLPSFGLPELTVLSRQVNHMAEALERSRAEN